MPKRPPADERKVNQVLREAERIAAKDRSSLSGDIIQFPASVQHALEAISHFEVTTRDIEEPSNVARGKRLADHLLAKVVDSAWQGARGNEGTEVLGCFIMALRGHMNDVQHILDIALKHAAAEFKFDVDDETGYPKCPHCGDVLDTLEADKVTTDEGVTLECEELVDGRFEYSCDSMDDGDMGGEINHEGYACPHCGKELPEVMQMLIDANHGSKSEAVQGLPKGSLPPCRRARRGSNAIKLSLVGTTARRGPADRHPGRPPAPQSCAQ